jgi:hypothetical protein
MINVNLLDTHLVINFVILKLEINFTYHKDTKNII